MPQKCFNLQWFDTTHFTAVWVYYFKPYLNLLLNYFQYSSNAYTIFNLKLKGLQCFLLYFHLNFDIFLYVKYFLEIIGGYSKSFHSVPALIDTKSTGDEDSLVRQPHIYILVHFLKDSPVVRQGDDQHQNLAK